MQVSQKNSIYLITRYGYVKLYDIGTETLIYQNDRSYSIIRVNRRGQVLSVSMDKETDTLNNAYLALRMVVRNNMGGAGHLFLTKFNDLFGHEVFSTAARVPANAPKGILRTPQTILKYQLSR